MALSLCMTPVFAHIWMFWWHRHLNPRNVWLQWLGFCCLDSRGNQLYIWHKHRYNHQLFILQLLMRGRLKRTFDVSRRVIALSCLSKCVTGVIYVYIPKKYQRILKHYANNRFQAILIIFPRYGSEGEYNTITFAFQMFIHILANSCVE